jgi:hypothetical protein
LCREPKRLLRNETSSLETMEISSILFATKFRRDVLFIDHSKSENSFISSFTPKKDYPYKKKKDLDELIKKTALLDFFLKSRKENGRQKDKETLLLYFDN